MSIANPHFAAPEGNAIDLRLKKRAALASFSLGAGLVTLKAYAYIATGSVSMLSSLMDSFFDAFASAVTVASVLHAATPADAQHRYGHGKAEALSALAQAVFIFVTACFLFYESTHRIFAPSPVTQAGLGVAVSVASIALTFALVAFQKRVIAQTRSVAISADYLHYKGDLLMNLGVIAALAITALSGIVAFDALFGMAVALHLLRGVWAIARQSIDILMDRELPEVVRDEIMRLVSSHPAAKAVHDLRTRNTGERFFIEFHLELDGALTLRAAHDITEDIERMIFAAYPASEVIIHQEPAGIDDHRLDAQVG